jgi:hypothetical protein
MSLNLPTIEELVEQLLIELSNKEEELLTLREFLKGKNPQIIDLIIEIKKEEIDEIKRSLDKHKELVREIKLKQILQ